MSSEILREGQLRITNAERGHQAAPGKLNVLKDHARRLESLEAGAEKDPAQAAQLLQRREAFRQRMADFLEPENTFQEKMPGQERFFEMRGAIEEGRKSGKLNERERLYLEANLGKTEHLQRDFESGGWTPWKRQLYTERHDALNRVMGDYMKEDFQPRGG